VNYIKKSNLIKIIQEYAPKSENATSKSIRTVNSIIELLIKRMKLEKKQRSHCVENTIQGLKSTLKKWWYRRVFACLTNKIS
jgi:mRNA-degrading endonuclease YafQ of YafQ-DinJ toxin-antitoxin module